MINSGVGVREVRGGGGIGGGGGLVEPDDVVRGEAGTQFFQLLIRWGFLLI